MCQGAHRHQDFTSESFQYTSGDATSASFRNELSITRQMRLNHVPTNAMMALTKSLGFGCVLAAELKTFTTKATAESAISESKHSLRGSQTFLDRRRLCKRFVKTARLRSVQERETFVRNA